MNQLRKLTNRLLSKNPAPEPVTQTLAEPAKPALTDRSKSSLVKHKNAKQKITSQNKVDLNNQSQENTNIKPPSATFWVANLIYKLGPLTSLDIWQEYLSNPEAQEKKILRSYTYLKQTVLKKMREEKQIKSAGYLRKEKKFLGWQLDPEQAFKTVTISNLMKMTPPPKVKRLQKHLNQIKSNELASADIIKSNCNFALFIVKVLDNEE